MQNIQETPPKNTYKKRKLARLWPVFIVLSGFFAFFALGLDDYLSFEALSTHRDALQAWVEAHGAWAVLAYIGLYGALVAFSLPGAVWLTLGAGFVFGAFWAGIYTVVGATIGAGLIFLAARYALADFFRAKAGSGLARMEDGFRKNAFSYLLFLRLVPVFPFWLVNLVPALLGMGFAPYMLATAVGIVPGTFVFAGVGAGLGHVFATGQRPDLGIIFAPQILWPMVALAGLSLLPVGFRLWRGRQNATARAERDDLSKGDRA